MRKILSLVVFTVALVGTWSLIHSSTAIGFETHSGIQEKLIQLITDTVHAKKPHAKDLQITRLWTEAVDDRKVRALFTYKFSEPSDKNEVTERTIEGEVLLHREGNATDKVDKWVIQNVHTTADSLTFNEGLLITPVAEPGEAAEPLDGTPSPVPATEPAASH